MPAHPPADDVIPDAPSQLPRWRRWLLKLGTALFWIFALLGVFRQVVNDRWVYTQPISWVPLSALVGLSCLAALACAALQRGRERRSWVFALALGALFLPYHWHWHRLLLRPGPGVRVLVWNPGWQKISKFDARVLEQQPQVFLVATPHYTANMLGVRQGMGETTFAAGQGALNCISVFPVRRWGSTPLNIPPAAEVPSWLPRGPATKGGGEAMFVVLDIPALGGDTTLWFLDLPSDPYIPRERMMRQALESIRAFRGPVHERRADGSEALRTLEVPGFPAPDILAGDLNTPRGTASLGQLMGPFGLSHAFAQAGIGPEASFPARVPVVHIDHVLVGPRLRATRYDIVDMEAGRHRAQAVQLRANAALPASATPAAPPAPPTPSP